MNVLNYLVLILMGITLFTFLLIDIYVFYIGITIIIEDLRKSKKDNIFYDIIATLLKISSEMVVIIVGYLIVSGLMSVVDIMMKGGNIQW